MLCSQAEIVPELKPMAFANDRRDLIPRFSMALRSREKNGCSFFSLLPFTVLINERTPFNMIRETIQTAKGKRNIRFRGVCKDALQLGVSRVHLYLVLSGRRESKRLLQRYEALRLAGKEHQS